MICAACVLAVELLILLLECALSSLTPRGAFPRALPSSTAYTAARPSSVALPALFSIFCGAHPDLSRANALCCACDLNAPSLHRLSALPFRPLARSRFRLGRRCARLPHANPTFIGPPLTCMQREIWQYLTLSTRYNTVTLSALSARITTLCSSLCDGLSRGV